MSRSTIRSVRWLHGLTDDYAAKGRRALLRLEFVGLFIPVARNALCESTIEHVPPLGRCAIVSLVPVPVSGSFIPGERQRSCAGLARWAEERPRREGASRSLYPVSSTRPKATDFRIPMAPLKPGPDRSSHSRFEARILCHERLILL